MSRFAATTCTIALLTVLAGRDTALAVEVVGCETGKLLASDADALDGFGEHLSVRGDVAVVGAWNDEENSQKIGGFSFGSAYVLRQVAGEWVEQQKLLPSDPVSELRFGHDVAIHGNRFVVGAVGSNGYTGAVYFYEFDGVAWGNEQKLEPATALGADEVGVAVAIDGDVAVAGAPGDDTAASGAGAAYVFRNVKGVWVEEQKIIADDAEAFDFAGSAVAVRGDTIFIASRVDDDQGVSTGSVWVYRFQDGSWQEVQKLYASDAVFGELFGHAIALGDGVAVISAIHDDDACPKDELCNSGSAYVFRFNGVQWVEEAKLVASDGEADDEFGNALAIEGDIVVVGTRFADDACPEDPGCDSGVAYVFHHDAGVWTQAGKLRASDTAQLDFFGADVAVNAGEALVSCHLDDDAGTASGSVYLFDAVNVGCPCPADLDTDGMVGINDFLDLLAAWGTPGGDIDGDGDTGINDFLTLLAAWGVCP